MQYERADDITWDEAGDRVVILDSDGGTVITLNPVGSLLWRQLDEPKDPEELAAHLRERFGDVPVEQIDKDVSDFVAQLVDEGLLVAASPDH